MREALIALSPQDLSFQRLIDLYLEQAPSRNFGLDLLPLWRHLDDARVSAVIGEEAPAARPTYHFRLPTSRIDDPGWTVTEEWAKWQLVEALARNPERLTQLRQMWCEADRGWLHREEAWVRRLDGLLPMVGEDPAKPCLIQGSPP